MNAHELYDAAFMRRAPDLAIRPETEADALFLAALFVDCSPLAALLPQQLLALQAAAREASYRQQHPRSMRRIALRGGIPVGRIVVDWELPDGSHGIDIAVLRGARDTLAGPQMLRAWLDTADALGLRCTLDVLADNRAQLLYRRLGFVLDPGHDPGAPVLLMSRAAPR